MNVKKFIAGIAIIGALAGGGVAGQQIFSGSAAVTQEVQIANQINMYRVSHHLHKLTFSSNLSGVAKAHSEDMIAKGYFAHSLDFPKAETIAWGTGGFGSPKGIVSLWRSSPVHRSILLTPSLRYVGIGIARGTFLGQHGATVVTADFTILHKLPNPPPPVTEPPVTVPTTPVTTPTGQVVGVPYTCNGPVHNIIVKGTGSDPVALINLKSGCTGDLSFDITVTNGGGDGVKVQQGVHDLNIGQSKIVCQSGVSGSFHQDGVQVQGGSNVTFHNLTIICPYVTGQGAAGFYIDGKDFGGISNVVCDGCNLEHLHYGAMFTSPAPGSGVRNSIIHQGLLTKGYYAFPNGSTGSVNSNNTLAPACDGASIPC